MTHAPAPALTPALAPAPASAPGHPGPYDHLYPGQTRLNLLPQSNSLVSLPRSSLDRLLKTTSPNLLFSRQYFLVPSPVLMSRHQGHIRDVWTLSPHYSTPVLTSSHSSLTLKISSLKNDRSLSDLLFPNSSEDNVEKQQTRYFLQPTETHGFIYISFI